MTPIIPPELCDEIISYLDCDTRTLCNCSLVCRSWVPASRTRLLSSFALSARCNFDTVFPLLRATHSTILPSIRCLYIEDSSGLRCNPEWVSEKLTQIPPFSNVRELRLYLNLWDKLPSALRDGIRNLFCGLTTLHIFNIEFNSFEDLAQLISSATSLKLLSLSCISCARKEISFEDLPAAPPLQVLYFYIRTDWNPTLVPVMRWLALRHSPCNHTLSIDINRVEDIPILSSFLLSLSECLENIILRFLIDNHEGGATSYRQVDLSLNKSLKTIVFCLTYYRNLQDCQWIANIVSQVKVHCSLQRVEFIVPPDNIRPLVTSLSKILEDENAMFVKKPTTLCFNISGNNSIVETREWFEHNLRGLDERWQVEVI